MYRSNKRVQDPELDNLVNPHEVRSGCHDHHNDAMIAIDNNLSTSHDLYSLWLAVDDIKFR